MTVLETERLRLRPVRFSDAEVIETQIFAEPEVVKGLAHNGASPERRRYHATEWSGFGPDGSHEFWDACQMGLYVIHDRSGSIAGPEEFLGVCGVFLEREQGVWNGELFYALSPSYQGQGIMSEAALAVLRRFDRLPEAGCLYAVYWHLLNPASGRVLQKMGFLPAGTRDLLDEYPPELYYGIRDFELWRLEQASSAMREPTLREVAIKLGHLERENIGQREDNLRVLQTIVGDNMQVSEVIRWLDQGVAAPGFGLLFYQPVN